jgi:hypothetical protein
VTAFSMMFLVGNISLPPTIGFLLIWAALIEAVAATTSAVAVRRKIFMVSVSCPRSGEPLRPASG